MILNFFFSLIINNCILDYIKKVSNQNQLIYIN